MWLRYETGIATFIQFIAGVSLTFLNGGASIISGCRGSGGADCVSNAFVSLLLVILIIAYYSYLLGLGYIAQDKRSSKLALLLIASEAVAGLIFLFDTRQAPGMIDKVTNGLSFLMTPWVAWVAFNLYRAKGARIVRKRNIPAR